MNRSTPERLRSAAWAIVRNEGIAAATSRRITEAADANLAAITYHFGSKQALIGEVVVEQLRSWTAPLTTALSPEPDDADIGQHDTRVAAAIATMLGRFATDAGDVESIVRLLVANPELPGMGDAAAQWLAELRAVATATMERQQSAGLIPSGVTPTAMAGVFTALAIGLVAQTAIDPDAPDAATIVSEFLGLLVRPPGA